MVMVCSAIMLRRSACLKMNDFKILRTSNIASCNFMQLTGVVFFLLLLIACMVFHKCS